MHSHPSAKRTTTKSIRSLPDLKHARTAVLDNLTGGMAKRYRRPVEEFIEWYGAENCQGRLEANQSRP